MPRKTCPRRHAEVRTRASMRPRPDAAENLSRGRERLLQRIGFNEAAARCRGKPSRSAARVLWRLGFNEAAARCRGKQTGPTDQRSGRTCFNEAAARCRGKRRQGRLLVASRLRASMRPRPDAAENGVRQERPSRYQLAASMRPRPDAAENSGSWPATAVAGHASMRPRPDAAENVLRPAPSAPQARPLQ